MARFPKAEAEIVALAEAMETGLAANVAIYPAPPVAVVDLIAAKNDYITAAEASTRTKDDKLKLIGWGGRVSGTALSAPDRRACSKPPTKARVGCCLDWKAPIDGGKPAAYR
jgi:hypothetical protein